MRIAASVPRDVADAVKSVWGPLERYAHPTQVDLGSRQMSNASNAVLPADLVTLSQVQGLIAAIETTSGDPSSPGGAVRVGAYVTRGAAQSHRGTFFSASDRNYVTWLSTGAAWLYAFGTQRGTITADQKPTLTTDDAGYLFCATDFDRVYRWNGSAWADAPGQEQRGQITAFDTSNLPNPSIYWAFCDGSAYDFSTASGGINNLATPDLSGRVLRGTASTTGVMAGADSIDPPSTASGAPSATVAVQSGAGTTVATDTHTHAVDLASINIVPAHMTVGWYIRL